MSEFKKYDIEGMHCAACVVSVEKEMSKLENAEDVSANLATETLQLKGDVTDKQVFEAVKRAGYTAKARKELSLAEDRDKENKRHDKKERALKNRTIASFIFLIPLFYIAMGPMFGLPLPSLVNPESNPFHFAIAQLILTTPIIIINWEIFSSGFKALFNKRPNMNSLVAIGTGAAYLYGLYATYAIWAGSADMANHLYYESAGMILALITLGNFFEEKATGQTSQAISALVNLAPDTAIRITANGEEETVEVKDLKLGDKVLIKPGSKVPIDGVILEGHTSVDESMITGESIPVNKGPQDKLTGATINTNGTVLIEVSAVGEDTTLSKIINLVREAQGTKAPISKLADEVSGVFVPVVIALAIISGLIWYFVIGSDVEFALTIFITTLVIACPCALGLATPTSIMVGTGKGAENGILYKSGEAIETASDVDVVIMDKTGTITNGTPEMTDFEVFNYNIEVAHSTYTEEQTLELKEETMFEVLLDVASIESLSEHPLSNAIVKGFKGKYKNYNRSLLSTSGFEALAGRGITGVVRNKRYYIGNTKLMKDRKVEVIGNLKDYHSKLSMEGKTAIFISRDNKLIGMIAVADTIKEDAKDAIKAIQDSGRNVIMLTGDNIITAHAIARQVGIKPSNVISEVLPADKANNVQRFMSDGKSVAMVGDGINDAPALAKANIGMAMGAGTDVAIESADVVIMNDKLTDVYSALSLSSATMKNIKQNLFFAFIYNVIGIPVAMGVFYSMNGLLLSPMIAGLAMSLSSISVVFNALRLSKAKIK